MLVVTIRYWVYRCAGPAGGPGVTYDCSAVTPAEFIKG